MEMFLPNALPFWDALKDDEKQLILNSVQKRRYAANSIVHHVGSDCIGMKIVKYGLIRVFVYSTNGSEITLYRLKSKDICVLSILCMLKNLNLDINIEAEEDSLLYIVPIDIYNKLLSNNKAVYDYDREATAQRLTEVVSAFSDVLFFSVGKRIADILVYYSNLYNSDVISITHEKLAKDIGTVREVVSRTIKNLQDLKLVEVSRGQIKM
ncbi:MAG TPA: hypothetical protein DC000_08715 [Clostridiales bacterium]|nr:hypothetical protein [Clostridiales bacterium]